MPFIPKRAKSVQPTTTAQPSTYKSGFTRDEIRQRVAARKRRAAELDGDLEQAQYESLAPDVQQKLAPGREQAKKNQSFGRQALAFGEDFARNLGTSVTGGLQGTTKGLANVGATAADIGGKIGEFSTGGLIKAPKEGAGESLRQLGQAAGGFIGQTGQELFEGDPIAREYGGYSGQALAMAAPLSVASKAEKSLKTLDALKNAPKAVKALQSLSGVGAESAIGTAGVTGVTQGRMPTKEELAAGGAIDLLLRGSGTALKGLGKKAFGLGVRPQVAGDSLTSWMKQEDIMEEAMDMGLVGTKKNIVTTALKKIKQAGKQLDNIVKKSNKKFTKNKLINSAVERAVELENIGDARGAKSMMKYIEDFKEGPDVLSPEKLLNLKRKAAERVLSTLKKGEMGGLSASAKKQVWEEIYSNASKLLDEIPGAQKWNRKMSVAYSVAEPTAKQIERGADIPLASAALSKMPVATPTTTLAGAGSRLAGKAMQNPLVRQLAKTTQLPGVAQLFGADKPFTPQSAKKIKR